MNPVVVFILKQWGFRIAKLAGELLLGTLILFGTGACLGQHAILVEEVLPGGRARLAVAPEISPAFSAAVLAGAGPITSASGKVNDVQLGALALAVGFRGDDAVAAVAVSKAENHDSDPTVQHKNGDGSIDTGLEQINSVHAPEFGGMEALKDPMTNFRAAYVIKGRQGWCGWFTYEVSCGPNHTGAYRAYLGLAEAAVDAAQASVKVPATSEGYVFPVFGYSGAIELHWGSYPGAADLFGQPLSPILAMRGGRVVSTSTTGPGGNSVLIQGDDGLSYYYAHMAEPSNVHGSVNTGYQLGRLGKTGNAESVGFHLHIGIGPSILDGTGPTGGAGCCNFDAVGLLRKVLSAQQGSSAPVQSPVPAT